MKKNLASILKHKITIQIRKQYCDEMGGRSFKWLDLRQCYASIQPLYNKATIFNERVEDSHLITNDYYEIIIRNHKNIANNMRILFEERVFNILRVIKDLNHSLSCTLITKEEIKNDYSCDN